MVLFFGSLVFVLATTLMVACQKLRAAEAVAATNVIARATTVLTMNCEVVRWSGVTIPHLTAAQWQVLTNAFGAYRTNAILIYATP